MITKNDKIDLCTNCLNTDHCFYNRNQKDQVIFCEEYTCDGSRESAIQNHGLGDGETRALDKEKQDLCINCRQMSSCNWDKNPKPK